jgi:heme A synthase
MQGHVFFEHSHRLVALVVTSLTVILATLLGLSWKKDRRLAWLGAGAVLTIVVQAGLGAATVLLKLPHPISIAHLSVSMLVFCFILYIAVRTRAGFVAATLPSVTRTLVVVAAGALYVQIVLGAVVRHTGAWAACFDEIPLCQNGQLWPPDTLARIQMAHRILACVVGALILAAAIAVFRATRARLARGLAGAAVLLVGAQIVLGALAVKSLRGLAQTEGHLAVGATLLATMWLLVLSTRRKAAEQVAELAPAAVSAAA